MSAEKPASSRSDRLVETQVLPVLEERLEVEVAREEVGAVRVRIEVEEHVQRVDAEQVEERMAIQTVPVGRVVSSREAPRREGDALVVPVYEEALVVERHLVLKEEIHLTPVRSTVPSPQQATLRRERAVIERQQPDGSWQPMEPPPRTDEISDPGV